MSLVQRGTLVSLYLIPSLFSHTLNGKHHGDKQKKKKDIKLLQKCKHVFNKLTKQVMGRFFFPSFKNNPVFPMLKLNRKGGVYHFFTFSYIGFETR